MNNINCSKCKQQKKKTDFYKDKRHLNGLASECKECRSEIGKHYYNKNKKKILERHKKWRKGHKEYLRNYYNTRIIVDIQYKLRKNMRTRICNSIKYKKDYSIIDILGCSIKQLKQYLEKKFKRGMNWKNYGPKWHIDHIKPLSKFDLTDKKQMLKAGNYKNLQPLFAQENLRKKDN